MAMVNAPLRPTIGVAVILTNDYVGYPDPRWGQLPGTREDHHTWKRALGDLRFDVRSYFNLNRQGTISLLEHVSTLEISAASSAVKQHLVFVYCGHGQKGCIVCQDGQRLSTDDVCKPFLQHRCGTGVAKLLFFDACRGEKRDRGRVYARSVREPGRVAERGGTIAQGELMPSEGNYLVVFSTLLDYTAQELPSSSSPSSPPHGMWSELFAPKLATCDQSLTFLILDVNREMVDQCRRLLSHPQSPEAATFQVAETCNALFEDVNLFAAAQLHQLSWPQMSARAPQKPSAPQPPPSPPLAPTNYQQRLENLKEQHELKVKGATIFYRGGCAFRLQVEWEGRQYTEQSQPCRIKEEAKEEAYRLMVERLEGLIRESDHPPAPPTNQAAAPPTNQAAAPPMPCPPAVQPIVVSGGVNKKYRQPLNECRQKVENAGGRWSLTGEPEGVAHSTFQCQLKLIVARSARAAQLHLVSKRVQVVGKKRDSKEQAAQDLVWQLQQNCVVRVR